MNMNKAAVVLILLGLIALVSSAGLACSSDAQCRRNVCLNGACSPKVLKDGTCERSEQCFGGLSCSGSKCVTCAEGQTSCSTGCKNTLSDNDNCGACGKVCVQSICSNGGCICEEGFANCDNSEDGSCETDTDSSLSHCGGCNQPCNGICTGGSCEGSAKAPVK